MLRRLEKGLNNAKAKQPSSAGLSQPSSSAQFGHDEAPGSSSYHAQNSNPSHSGQQSDDDMDEDEEATPGAYAASRAQLALEDAGDGGGRPSVADLLASVMSLSARVGRGCAGRFFRPCLSVCVTVSDGCVWVSCLLRDLVGLRRSSSRMGPPCIERARALWLRGWVASTPRYVFRHCRERVVG